jgi:hypothetical protein
MVSEQVRAAEFDIDERIRRLPIWNSQKDLLLRGLMDFWRDGLELAYVRAAHSAMFSNSKTLEAATAIEHQVNTGVFWCLKWAFEYAPSSAGMGPTAEELVDAVVKVGAPYQLLVDALKFANIGGNEIDVDAKKHTLILYEGGDVSGYDHGIVSRDHASLPFHKQTPLVEDSDQLTKGWTAGEYRKCLQWLRSVAERAETETILAQAGPLSPKLEVCKRPVVLELPEPPAELRNVQRDLTLTQHKIDSGMKWKVSEWQDCPLVQIGPHVYGVSSVVKALAGCGDYMLRVAVLNDRERYEKTSGLREARMLAACKAAFESAGWRFRPHLRLTDPPREIDGYAAKGRQDIVVQLKSTLRPQSPWEVHKRNSDVIDGIRHTANVLPRFRAGAVGFVVTDGYEGDYSTWVESLNTGVPVATLQDLGLIACNPTGAFQILARRAGIEGKPTFQPLSERVTDLCGWTLRLVDSTKPA